MRGGRRGGGRDGGMVGVGRLDMGLRKGWGLPYYIKWDGMGGGCMIYDEMI